MEKLELDLFFYPKQIAVVGVSSKNINFGGSSFLLKLLESNYSGKLYPINPNAKDILGLKAYPNLSALPVVPEMAMVCVPAIHVPKVLEECAQIGTRHIHILTSGFKELGTEDGNRLEAKIISISKENGLLVIGPNCMGPYCPSSGLTAWGAIPGLSGPVGIISQSGSITQRLSEYLYFLGVGVEKAVSIGNATVLNSLDYLEYMAKDDKIKIVAMYVEGIDDGRKFLGLAKKICQTKPIILWKGGESGVGAATALSHTGAMSGEQKLWQSFFRQTGAVHVQSMDEWADTVLAFVRLPAPKGKGVFLVGGGGGNSVTNSDVCIRKGLKVPSLSDKTMSWLRNSVPAAGSIPGNPLDHWQVFEDPVYLGEVLDRADQDPAVSMVVIDRLVSRKAFHTLEEKDSTPRFIEVLAKRQQKKPAVFTVDSEGGDPELAVKGANMRAQYCKAGIPAYPSMSRAAKALVRLHDYYKTAG